MVRRTAVQNGTQDITAAPARKHLLRNVRAPGVSRKRLGFTQRQLSLKSGILCLSRASRHRVFPLRHTTHLLPPRGRRVTVRGPAITGVKFPMSLGFPGGIERRWYECDREEALCWLPGFRKMQQMRRIRSHIPEPAYPEGGNLRDYHERVSSSDSAHLSTLFRQRHMPGVQG